MAGSSSGPIPRLGASGIEKDPSPNEKMLDGGPGRMRGNVAFEKSLSLLDASSSSPYTSSSMFVFELIPVLSNDPVRGAVVEGRRAFRRR